MFINLNYFFTKSRNPFVNGDRKMPIYFGYPKQEKYQITISIPEGYVVESVPAPIKIATVQNVGLFVLTFFQRKENTNFLYRRNKRNTRFF
jgi:hypothetical protein